MALKRINIQDLKLGMFVSELDISWVKSPFFRHKRLIVKQEDIEQELIFHTEGDPFHYSEFCTLDDAIGSYLIKHKEDIFKMPQHTFEILFNVPINTGTS